MYFETKAVWYSYDGEANAFFLKESNPFVEMEISADFRNASLPIMRGLFMVDTGSTQTLIDASALKALSIDPCGQRLLNSHAGLLKASLYRTMIRFPGFPAYCLELIASGNEVPLGVPNSLGVIGLDVLRHCRLVLDGPSGDCTLQIPIPDQLRPQPSTRHENTNPSY